MKEIAGFSLMEVMVAMAILGVGLTAIFASEAGAMKVSHRSRQLSTATMLARCKMGEIEQEVADEGFPAVELTGDDGCCEDAEIDNYRCEWSVERIVLPEPGLEEDALGEGEGEEEGSGGGPLDGFGPDSSMQDVLEGAGSGGGDMMAEMALSYAYPILKPALEEQVRRAMVTVKWKNWRGSEREHSFEVVQYLVAEQPPPAPEAP